ncbi:hypothetical protein NKH77_09490 [Streptomyces sp. M19]
MRSARPLGIAGLRLGWAGLILLLVVRPRRRDFTARDLGRARSSASSPRA